LPLRHVFVELVFVAGFFTPGSGFVLSTRVAEMEAIVSSGLELSLIGEWIRMRRR